jgi:hypothetical protein
MKIKLNQEIFDADGKTIPAGTRPKLLLKDICINAVLTPIQTDKPEDKQKKYEIWRDKLRDVKTEVDLTIEEVALIKKCIGMVNPQLIMGQANDMLEGK